MPGCSMARSPRPVAPAPCSSTGGRGRTAVSADTTAPGIPYISSRAMGGIRGGRPIDDGANDNSVEPVAAVEPFQRVEPLGLALGAHDGIAQRGVRPGRVTDV